MRSLWLGKGGFCRKILRPAKSGKPATITSGFSLPACRFQLFTSGFSLKLFCALLETTNRFNSYPWQGESALLQDC
jgi:hypothetical protein